MSSTQSNVVFIPGLGLTGGLFKPIIRELEDEFECQIFDQQSHDRFDEMVSFFLEQAPERFSLIGHSMGGGIIFEIMRQAPSRVNKIILISTTARGDNDEKAQNRYEMIELAQSGAFEQVAFRSYPNLVHPAYGDDPVLFGKIVEMFMQTGSKYYINQQNALLNRPASLDELSNYECPVLVIFGEQDLITPPENGEEISSRISNCRLEILPGCGHIPPLEAPERMKELIKSFLRA